MRARISAISLVAILTGCSDDGAPKLGGDLHSVLWIQTAAEYEALCHQTYRTAQAALPALVADTRHTAALEQTGDFAEKPPAVIVDVDETVLDNAPYNARLLRNGAEFTPESWAEWVRDQRADALPGATAFFAACHEHGVTVFYVTNRDVELEAETRANLEAEGIHLTNADVDEVRLRNEYDADGSEKSPRRTEIAKDYRIIMLIGDDLGDFLPYARQASLEERAQNTEKYVARWGTSWFVLPNPIYGSWLRRLGEEPMRYLDTAK
ncbi:MAG: 5'-nucleotidase, lipoprotein e(P4) family [Planctomycetes bacterium]|nr:5'-nucleotidase, lipoprotein e(P4) family [Planctomycetota bacterium]